MVKRAPVALADCRPVSPGKFLVLVTGEVAAVDEAFRAGLEIGGDRIVDRLFLAQAHPLIGPAVRGAIPPAGIESLAAVETTTVAAAILAADAAVKAAAVRIVEMQLGAWHRRQGVLHAVGPARRDRGRRRGRHRRHRRGAGRRDRDRPRAARRSAGEAARLSRRKPASHAARSVIGFGRVFCDGGNPMSFRTYAFLFVACLVLVAPAKARAQAPAAPPVFKPAPPAAPAPGPVAAPAKPESPAPAAPPAPATPGATPATATPPAQSPPVPSPPAAASAGKPPGTPPANAPPPGYPPGYGPPPGYPPASYPPGYAPPPGYPTGSYPYPYPYAYPYPYPSAYPPPAPPPPAHPPGAGVHDGGYIRLQLGLNWTGVTARVGSDTVTYNGAGGSISAAFGYSFTQHLILYAEFFDAGAIDATVKTNGASTNTGQSMLGTDLSGLGLGAAYYFGPNVFAAATVLDCQIDVSDSSGATLVESQNGLGLELLFGKEWWASDNWGLGVSGQVIFASMKGKDTDLVLNQVPSWHTTSLSLLFSATYN